MEKEDKIFITGHNGMVGKALTSRLQKEGFTNLILKDRSILDLRDSKLVKDFFKEEKPDIVFVIAARVGGIAANMASPADFLYDNLMIEANLIHNSYLNSAKKVIFLGSSCIYPKDSPQPMKESYLLTGPLEPTNEGYAIAKIAGLKLIEFYHAQYGLKGLSVMPSNLYGPNDSFHPQNSHVLSALVKKVVDAMDNRETEVTLWGTGVARREFLHIHDLIDAILFLEKNYDSPEIINVGTGIDLSIKELAEMISKLVGYEGLIKWDSSKPDGMLRKCMDITKLSSLGFRSSISLNVGIGEMISEYRKLKNNSIKEHL